MAAHLVIGVGHAIALAADAIAGCAAAVVAKHRFQILLEAVVGGLPAGGLRYWGCWQQFSFIHRPLCLLTPPRWRTKLPERGAEQLLVCYQESGSCLVPPGGSPPRGLPYS